MWDIDDLSFSPDEFSGTARVFPLPNLVMFPHVMQALRVFEPRYVEMVEDALAGDRLIAMGLLEAGWEADYEGRPPIAPIACLGKIATYHRDEEGRYNFMLLGLTRIRLVRELEPSRAFRQAEATLLVDQYQQEAGEKQGHLRSDLLAAFNQLRPQLPAVGVQLDELLVDQVSLGMLTDIVGYTLPVDLDFKQQLLAERSVDRRAEMLLGEMQHLATAAERHAWALSEFPPKFSPN